LLPDQLLGGVGMPDLTDEQSEMMEKELRRTEAIIDSMTREERANHIILTQTAAGESLVAQARRWRR